MFFDISKTAKIKNEIKGDAILVYATSPFIQCLGALHLAKKLKVPLIIWIQDLWPESISDTIYQE